MSVFQGEDRYGLQVWLDLGAKDSSVSLVSAFFAWTPLPGSHFVGLWRQPWAAAGLHLPYLAILEECERLFLQSLSTNLRQALIGPSAIITE